MTLMTRLGLLFAVLLPAVLGACAQDPYQRPGTWSLPPDGLGANDSNLRTMLINPSDLTSPHGDEETSVGALATQPVAKLYSGHRAPLPNVSTSQIGGGGSGGQQQGGPSGSDGGSALGTGPQY